MNDIEEHHDVDEETDYCQIPLTDIKDEGPLVAAAGYLGIACQGENAGKCGPHAALPTLYSLRFSIELAFHGATQALEEGRNCSGRTNQITHILTKLFDTWEMNLRDSSTRLNFYDKKVPENHDIKQLIDKFHQLDPKGVNLRYPTEFPDFANVCEAIEDACKTIELIIDRTTPLIPKTKLDCLKRLSFLKTIAQNPCLCQSFSDFEQGDNLIEPSPNSWPESWPQPAP